MAAAQTKAASTNPATVNAMANTQQLAATGASGTILLAVVGGALLLLGGASFLAKFRRRTRG
ncbi:LPXTG cell wall anchor domain-containing protein [Arthrobacter alpinus]|nr:LPXTG cell wall anchor domain-containing protein [Arthrobacter alpinus]